MLRGNIFNFQRFSIHDGPGIRTSVFFKGCPLKCMWCHNPESQSFRRELMYSADKCLHCQICNGIYANSVELSEIEDGAFDCPNGALEVVGNYYTVKEALKEILKDRLFYEESGGGVTFSGGEPMAHINYLEALAIECKRNGISTVIDTSGHVPYSNFERILEYCDLFLYDVKTIDPILHKTFTGVDNRLILDNLHKLSESGANIRLRFPIIKGINLNDAHLEGL